MKLILIFICVLFIIIVGYILLTLNLIIKFKNRVNEAFSTMDVYMKKRWDLIPNIVEVVKGYTTYEKDVLDNIVMLRKNVYESMNYNDKIVINQELSTNIGRLVALTEDYPELKANEAFMKLADELSNVEDEIASSRKYYNGCVRMYNDKIQMFPSSVIAFIFGYKSKKMFEISEKERTSISIEL